MRVELHDGSAIVLRKLDREYDPTNRISAMGSLMEASAAGEITTGLLYLDESVPGMHEVNNTTDTPLIDVPYDALCPGNETLAKLQSRYR
jgi:2-oxoglutarate ferredoxin oxidoreductase subunit beta